MTLHQIEALLLVAAMFTLFALDRWRYDVVAMATLLAGVLLGVVKPDHAFEGFSNSVIVVIASVLVVSKAISRAAALDAPVSWLLGNAKTTSARIAVLASCVAFLSAFLKNVGTLGIFIPIAIKTARKAGDSPSRYLMPLSFASLVGGAMTLVGTSPNLLVSAIRENLGGKPFTLFDFTWVGLPLTCVAIAFLTFGWRLTPADRVPAAGPAEQGGVARFLTELRVPEDSSVVGKSVGDFEDLVEGDTIVIAILRAGKRQDIPSRRRPISAGDVLLVQGEPETVRNIVDKGGLELAGTGSLKGGADAKDLESIEAIVGLDSPLIGESAESLHLRHRHDTNLLAVNRAGRAVAKRLRSHTFQAGDVVVLQGFRGALPATLAELGCLPLADRNLGLGNRRAPLVSVAILAAAIVAIVARLVPVEIGFFAAALAIIVAGQITLKTAYGAIEGPVLVMLGALISFSGGLKETGVTELVGRTLASVAGNLPPSFALGFILVVTMVATPVLHHAPAVLIIGPLAAALAKELGLNSDPFLMAVALGAACDFLTPIGHQNNLLVMGPGGYRFGDYWKLGLPLSTLVVFFGLPLILFFWPLA